MNNYFKKMKEMKKNEKKLYFEWQLFEWELALLAAEKRAHQSRFACGALWFGDGNLFSQKFHLLLVMSELMLCLCLLLGELGDFLVECLDVLLISLTERSHLDFERHFTKPSVILHIERFGEEMIFVVFFEHHWVIAATAVTKNVRDHRNVLLIEFLWVDDAIVAGWLEDTVFLLNVLDVLLKFLFWKEKERFF